MNTFKNVVGIMFHEIGFESLNEILKSTVAWKHNVSSIYVFAVSFGGILSMLEVTTEKYIYTPALGVLILWLTTILDVLLGASVAITLKKEHNNNLAEGLNPNKLGRAFIRLIVQTTIVALFYQMSKAWNLLINNWMVDSLLIIFTLSTFYSVLQNANKLQLITDEQYRFIEGLVNIKELISKLKNKK